jgi:hypothetical protein
LSFLIAAAVIMIDDPGTICTSVLGVPLSARSSSLGTLDGEGFLGLKGRDKHYGSYWPGCSDLHSRSSRAPESPGSGIAVLVMFSARFTHKETKIDEVDKMES